MRFAIYSFEYGQTINFHNDQRQNDTIIVEKQTFTKITSAGLIIKDLIIQQKIRCHF